MVTVGPNNPGTMADDSAVGTVAWTNPNNAKEPDSNVAFSTVIGATATTHYLKATNFGFSIPTMAVIDGITVEFLRNTSKDNGDVDYIRDVEIKIVKGGSISSTNKADTVTNWSTTETYFDYGSSSDLWGETWTPADINGSTFGVVLSVEMKAAAAISPWVNHIRIKVDYTLPNKINIGDAFKGIESMKINIGDVWKDVNSIKINIGDVWKTVF